MEKIELESYRGEPCGAIDGNFPAEVLRAVPDFDLPMWVALSVDRKTLLLMDSVDYYQTRSLNKADAVELARRFLAFVELMEF